MPVPVLRGGWFVDYDFGDSSLPRGQRTAKSCPHYLLFNKFCSWWSRSQQKYLVFFLSHRGQHLGVGETPVGMGSLKPAAKASSSRCSMMLPRSCPSVKHGPARDGARTLSPGKVRRGTESDGTGGDSVLRQCQPATLPHASVVAGNTGTGPALNVHRLRPCPGGRPGPLGGGRELKRNNRAP